MKKLVAVALLCGLVSSSFAIGIGKFRDQSTKRVLAMVWLHQAIQAHLGAMLGCGSLAMGLRLLQWLNITICLAKATIKAGLMCKLAGLSGIESFASRPMSGLATRALAMLAMLIPPR